ncbi:sulfite exporter TauE/SafE family protein [Telmatospirillum sp. J64-1]|uniref:sulfite exporter TauE/SafE family protein n=1 Tax=Telmatospirillum sp. J64-1 TaxID=2502183 RepID=UPI00115EC738|nr:sulfite exporter TauE/SafE family protein [Telmatospirillum sp. J64-1]
MTIYLLLAVFGVGSGITTVLFGFGGGFVTVPLIYLLITHAEHYGALKSENAMQMAVATSTCVMIATSAIATWQHAKRGNIITSQIWPMAVFIGVGAFIGAQLATIVSSNAVKWAFVIYLGLTIIDCLLRDGFIRRNQAQNLVSPPTAIMSGGFGIGIGIVAAFLGVGGSVMTVPLMRRRGMDMTKATAMANPLTVPVAFSATITYMLSAPTSPIAQTAWQIGYVDLAAFLVLICGALVGMRAALPMVGRIPDAIHAKIYIFLLVLVLLAMII